MKKSLIILLLPSWLYGQSVLQEAITDITEQRVILYSDGTWKYKPLSQSSPPIASTQPANPNNSTGMWLTQRSGRDYYVVDPFESDRFISFSTGEYTATIQFNVWAPIWAQRDIPVTTTMKSVRIDKRDVLMVRRADGTQA